MPFSPVLAYYLHNLSPYVIRFGERFGVHWYGLAYVLGFYCCYLMLVHLARKGYSELKAEQAGDFITYLALFGVVVGGRVGYMLLYNFEGFLKDPISIVRLWDGGMASHGGIAGIALFTLYWSWKHKISWTNLGDNIVVGAPIGILFGRLANFINGELYGRVTDVSWAMKFPTEIHNENFVPAVANSLNYPALPQHSNEIIAAVKTLPNGMQELEVILHPRHPSQLYEAALEGLFLTVVLYLIRTRVKNLSNGVLTGLFFILYAGVRIFGEHYREPDADLIMGITRGQFYSLFMILIGLAFLGWALLGKRKAAPAK